MIMDRGDEGQRFRESGASTQAPDRKNDTAGECAFRSRC